MSRQKEITVDVALDGSVKIEGNGFEGASCEKATKFLEDALGEDRLTKKPDYHRKAEVKRSINQ